MAELSPQAQDLALAAVFLDGPVTMGLTRRGEEITDPGYERLAIDLAEPQSVADPRSHGEAIVRALTNRVELRYGPWKEDTPGPVDGWIIFDENGQWLARGVGDPQSVNKGEDFLIRSKRILLGLA